MWCIVDLFNIVMINIKQTTMIYQITTIAYIHFGKHFKLIAHKFLLSIFKNCSCKYCGFGIIMEMQFAMLDLLLLI